MQNLRYINEIGGDLTMSDSDLIIRLLDAGHYGQPEALAFGAFA
jgi:hypothetical protein